MGEVKSQSGIYSGLMLNVTEQSWKRKKWNIYAETRSFRNTRHKTTVILKSDCAGPFRTVPSPILREHRRGNRSEWLNLVNDLLN